MGALEALFALVRDFAREQGIDERREKDLALVAEELFTNLLRHNRGGGDDVACDLWRDGGRAVLRLADRDVAPYDGSGVPDPFSRDGEGGFGVHIVRRLTERLAYDWSGGVLTVTAVLNLEDGDVHHREA